MRFSYSLFKDAAEIMIGTLLAYISLHNWGYRNSFSSSNTISTSSKKSTFKGDYSLTSSPVALENRDLKFFSTEVCCEPSKTVLLKYYTVLFVVPVILYIFKFKLCFNSSNT